MLVIEVSLGSAAGRVNFPFQHEIERDAHRIFAAAKRAAVDMALAKLEQQLRRYKEKIQDHRRRLSTGEAAGAPAPEEA